MTDVERAALDAINRFADLEVKFARVAQEIHVLGVRTEGQYEMLSKRLDRAAEEVMKIKMRLKKLEERPAP